MGSNARSKFLGSAKEVVYFFFKYGSSIFFIFYFTLLGYNIRVKFISQWWGWSSPPFVFPWLGTPPVWQKIYFHRFEERFWCFRTRLLQFKMRSFNETGVKVKVWPTKKMASVEPCNFGDKLCFIYSKVAKSKQREKHTFLIAIQRSTVGQNTGQFRSILRKALFFQFLTET